KQHEPRHHVRAGPSVHRLQLHHARAAAPRRPCDVGPQRRPEARQRRGLHGFAAKGVGGWRHDPDEVAPPLHRGSVSPPRRAGVRRVALEPRDRRAPGDFEGRLARLNVRSRRARLLLYPFRYLWWLVSSIRRSIGRPPAFVVFVLEENLPALPDPPPPLWQRFVSRQRLSVKVLGERFDAIARDARIKGVVLHLRAAGMPMATLQYLRELVGRLRNAGKRVVSWAPSDGAGAKKLIDCSPYGDDVAVETHAVDRVVGEEGLPAHLARGAGAPVSIGTWERASRKMRTPPPTLRLRKYIALMRIEGTIIDGRS